MLANTSIDTFKLIGFFFTVWIPLSILGQQRILTEEPTWSLNSNKDWLIDGSGFHAEVYKGKKPGVIVLSNGLIKREFLLSPNATTIGFENLMTGESILRGVKPEAEISIDGINYEIGGLKGQKNYAFLRAGDIEHLENDPAALQFVDYQVSTPEAPFEWKKVRHHTASDWPPPGVHLRLEFQMPGEEAVKRSSKSLPSGYSRRLIQNTDFSILDSSWQTYSSTAHPRSSFQNEGKIGEIYTPENTCVFVERALSSNVGLVETTLDIGTDKSKAWGPGIALLWKDKIIKFYLRPGGNAYDDGVAMFGLWDGKKEFRAAGGRQELDLSKPWTLRLRIDDQWIYCEAKPEDGSWRLVEKLDFDGVKPLKVRIGKMDGKGGSSDYSGEKGNLARLRILDYHAYSEVVDDEVNKSHLSNVKVFLHYELYDGIPVMAKWMTVENNTGQSIVIDKFTSEIIAAVEYGSAVEARKYLVPKPNIHVETDYAFASFNVDDANHNVVHWEKDPDYKTQVNYLRLTPCLLRVAPSVGPGQVIEADQQFTTFRTFILPYDSYERERQGLSLRKMYRTLAPWTTENPLMMHARFADWEQVKQAIDQCAEVGFEMVILTFGSGFNIEDNSEEYLAKMKKYAEYAQSKGIEIGGYSLLASRRIGKGQDVEMPPGHRPTFGNSPCIGSEWGQEYFRKLYEFYDKTGFSLLEHDGSYPGDVCVSENHPGHTGYLDSRWNQFQVISKFYRWCRSKGIYLNVPDYYYMNGSNKCGMGYREVNWSLPRAQQVLHTRQNIYDGSWTKLPSMGWMFVPLTEYHGGGEAATIEPLNEHLEHYELMMMSNLGAGVQACYRGPRLFDTEDTKSMVKRTVNWYKKHRDVLEGDIIHLRRADGRDIDYWLSVNPQGKEKGMLLVFNPLKEDVSKRIRVPLYYTGLKDKVLVTEANNAPVEHMLGRDYSLDIIVEVKRESYTWVLFE